MSTRVTVEHMADVIALPWRYCVEDDRGRECWAGQCQTREQAYACVRAHLRTLWRHHDARSRLATFLRGSQPQSP